MSSDARKLVVQAAGLGKCYPIYARPQDRLREFFARRGRSFHREFWALREVDLDARSGETLGIIGRNGAGKSTLLQMIAGTLQPTEGSVQVSGRVTALLELGSGFHHDFTGRENVYLAGAILGLDREAMDARFGRIADFAGIGEFVDRPVKTYSKGMFTRLAFAVYANLDPDVFIVDEALAVGDAKFRHKCMYRFRQMQEQGVSILYVSHDATSMKQLCDRVAWIDAGRLRMAGDPSEVVDAYLNDLFHGESQAMPPRRAAGLPEAAALRGDDRAGSGRCRFVDARLFDESGAETGHLALPGACELRVTLRNVDLDPSRDRLQSGFRIQDVHGVVIAGTNSRAERSQIPLPSCGQDVTLRYRIRLPRLARGSYAWSITASVLDEDGQPRLCDEVVNAIVLQTTTDRDVHGMIGIECELEVLA